MTEIATVAVSVATKINMANVGWRAFVDKVVLATDLSVPNGAVTTKATLDQIALNQNELIDRVAAVEEAVKLRPFV